MAMQGNNGNKDNDDEEKKVEVKPIKNIQIKSKCLGGCGKTKNFEWATAHGKEAWFTTKENTRNGWCKSDAARRSQTFGIWCFQNKKGIIGQLKVRWDGDNHREIKKYGGPMTPIDALFSTQKGTHIRFVQTKI